MRGGDAYAARERIGAVHPRFTGPGGARVETPERTPDGDDLGALAGIDVRALLEALAERWTHVRESIGETTFYLTDPNSWR